MIGGVSRSNSSWIGPTSSSSTFSRVDHADDAAVLVEQHRQVHPVALKFEQELVEPERHRQERDLARELAQVGPPVLIAPVRKMSLTWIMPMTVVRSSSQSGKRV